MSTVTLVKMSGSKSMALAGLASGIVTPSAFALGYMLSSPIVGKRVPVSSWGLISFMVALILPPFIALLAGYIVLKLFNYKFPFKAALASIGFTILTSTAAYVIFLVVASRISLIAVPNQSGYDSAFILIALAYVAVSTICFGLVGKMNERAVQLLSRTSGLILAIYSCCAALLALLASSGI
ncbi:MAG TPA: hypothetical protein VNX65_05110 [Patescibacteria group bacterium]|jgi:hypothetical protein|nr:hypothetical protein [Patescibacteria group bacterium]